MATALISGLANPPRAHIQIQVCDPNERARNHLEKTFDIPTFTEAGQQMAVSFDKPGYVVVGVRVADATGSETSVLPVEVML